MKNLSKVLIGILVVIIIIAIPVVSGYNNLVALEQKLILLNLILILNFKEDRFNSKSSEHSKGIC